MRIYFIIVAVIGMVAAIWSSFYHTPVFLTVPCAYAAGTLFASQLTEIVVQKLADQQGDKP